MATSTGDWSLQSTIDIRSQPSRGPSSMIDPVVHVAGCSTVRPETKTMLPTAGLERRHSDVLPREYSLASPHHRIMACGPAHVLQVTPQGETSGRTETHSTRRVPQKARLRGDRSRVNEGSPRGRVSLNCFATRVFRRTHRTPPRRSSLSECGRRVVTPKMRWLDFTEPGTRHLRN